MINLNISFQPLDIISLTQIFNKTVHVCYMKHEAYVLRRLLVNTTWSEERSIEDSEENLAISYPNVRFKHSESSYFAL